MTPPSDTPPVRRRLIEAAIRMLEESGPEALQARKLAAEIGASTMAVYTHFGGIAQLLDEVAREGFVRFGERLGQVGESDDPIADLLAQGMAYRAFALANPQLYRLMFGLTTPGLRRTRERDLTVDDTPSEMPEGSAAFERLARVTERAVRSGRIGSTDTTALAGQIWSLTHGYVLLESAGVFGHEGNGLTRVLGPLITTLLVGLGDSRDAIDRSFMSAQRVVAGFE